MHSDILVNTLIFLVAAVIVVPLFKAMRSSSVIGYLAAGLLIGPSGVALIEDADSIHALAEFGVVFLLFKIGLELSIERLRLMKKYVFGLGSCQVLLTSIAIAGVAILFGQDTGTAIVIGGALALSSTAFVLQLLAERHEQTSRFGLVSFAILLMQDIAVVPFLALIPLLAESETSVLAALEIAALKTSIALIGILVLGRLLLRPMYRVIAATKSPELFVATTLLILLGTSWAMHLAGLSMALGAFLAGSLLAETEYRHQIEADIRPFKGILLGLFFMAVGLSIDTNTMQQNWIMISAVVAMLIVGKTLIITLLCMAFKLSVRVSIRAGLLLSQGGEFGFVLMDAATKADILDEHVKQILLASIIVSMVLTPLLVAMGERVTKWLDKRNPKVKSQVELKQNDLNEHVLIAGFGRVGQSVAKVLSVSGISYIALDLDHARVTRARAKQVPVFYGDSSRIEVLTAAGAAKAKAAVITISKSESAIHVVKALRNNFPDLPIFVRSRDRQHSHELEQNGATAVVPETSESSLQLGAIVLAALGTGSDEVHHVIDEFRQNDYEKLEDMIMGYDRK